MTGRLHDFACEACGTVYADVWINREHTARRAPFHCTTCGAVLVWIPHVGRMDALEPCQEFDITVKDPRTGGDAIVHIDSLHKLRQVERESEIRTRNGEGSPLVWRDYSQNQSNHDVHTLGVDPGVAAKEHLRTARRHAMKEVFASEAEAPSMGSGAHAISPLESL